MTSSIELSIIIPVTERHDETAKLFYDYKQGIEFIGMSYEIIYILDGEFPNTLATLKKLIDNGEKITIIILGRSFGEAVALDVGFKHSKGSIILTLPAYQQIPSNEFPRLIQALDSCDMVVASRWPRRDSQLNRFQAKIFNFLLRKLTGLRLHDAGCGVKAFKRSIFDEVIVYGEQHRFLPVLAYRNGFKIKEIQVPQADNDTFQRVHPISTYIRRLLDLLTIYFLIKFTKKPLRFFGLFGLSASSMGILITFYVVIERLIFDVALSTRPALILSSLLIVLGLQLLAMGLIGEIIIFTHAKEIKEYTIEEIIN